MENEKKMEPTSGDLLTYLDIATKFRNHEFNIQLLRNVIFTSAEGIMITCYAYTISQCSLCSLVIALFGIVFSVIWFFYYRDSLYWVWFWENRCRQVNDNVVKILKLPVNIFDGHPVGSNDKAPPIKFAGKTITYGPVHSILRVIQIVFCLMWFILMFGAGIRLIFYFLKSVCDVNCGGKI